MAAKPKTTLQEILSDAKAMKRATETVEGYLETLKPEDRAALEALAKLRGFASVGGLAVSLLGAELRTTRQREREARTRTRYADDAFARRWSERIREALQAQPKATWLDIDKRAAVLAAHESYPGSAQGHYVLDVRNREEILDREGSLTVDSVAAWLLGREKPDPKLPGRG